MLVYRCVLQLLNSFRNLEWSTRGRKGNVANWEHREIVDKIVQVRPCFAERNNRLVVLMFADAEQRSSLHAPTPLHVPHLRGPPNEFPEPGTAPSSAFF